jgi:hypothetical protein
MKLRIHDNTLRLRLSDEELERFVKSGYIESSLRFGPEDGSLLVYSLRKNPGATEVSAKLVGDTIRFGIGPEQAELLNSGDEYFFESEHSLGGEDSIKIFVERDLHE